MPTRTLLLVAAALCAAGGARGWSYSDQATWGMETKPAYPACAAGSQSPVELDEAFAARDLTRGTWAKKWGPITDGVLDNTGHDLKFHVPANEKSNKLTKYPNTTAQFILKQVHFHISDRAGQRGSEHTVPRQTFEGEAHIIHYNARYSSYEEAQPMDDGLAVVAVLLKETDAPANTFLASLLPHLPMWQGSRSVVPTANINAFLPEKSEDTFFYKGSLTTPPCYTSVRWAVLKEPLEISPEQFAELRTLRSGRNDDSPLVNNWRDTQDLGGRTITVNWPKKKAGARDFEDVPTG